MFLRDRIGRWVDGLSTLERDGDEGDVNWSSDADAGPYFDFPFDARLDIMLDREKIILQ